MCCENLVWWCAYQHNLTNLTVTSCNIRYLLGHSSKGTVDSAPMATVHYLHCEVFSNVCMSERPILGLTAVGLKVQYQNGCKDVLGTWPSLLSHLAVKVFSCMSMPGMLFCIVQECASLPHVDQSHHFCVRSFGAEPVVGTKQLFQSQAKLRLDTMETSSVMKTFTLQSVVFITFWEAFDSAQYPAIFPLCSTDNCKSLWVVMPPTLKAAKPVCARQVISWPQVAD